MTGQDIITEVKARGFDYVSDTRILRWVNVAYGRINDRESWPFLEAETSGTSPLTISDLRAVLSVVDITAERPLQWEDLRDIRGRDPDLDASGTPYSWYLDGDDLTAYPTTTDSLNVQYLSVPADIETGTSPLWPARYHYVLVDAAVAEALKDTDNFENLASLIPYIEGGVEDMRNSLMVQHLDTAAEILPSFLGSTDW